MSVLNRRISFCFGLLVILAACNGDDNNGGVGVVFPAGTWHHIAGTYNVYEAAHRNGVKRILFATSNHAVGFYRRDETIDHRVYPRPDSRYGVSKVFGEALGSLYADKYGMEIFNMRIGNVNARHTMNRLRMSLAMSRISMPAPPMPAMSMPVISAPAMSMPLTRGMLSWPPTRGGERQQSIG